MLVPRGSRVMQMEFFSEPQEGCIGKHEMSLEVLSSLNGWCSWFLVGL